MHWTRTSLRTMVLAGLLAAPAAAQTTSVGAALDVDIVRGSRIETDARSASTGLNAGVDGAAIGVTGRIARALDDRQRWGVAFEAGVSRTIETRTRVSTGPVVRLFPDVPLPFPLPEFAFEQQSEQRHTTLTTLAWVRIPARDRLALDVSGGLTFARIRVARTIEISDRRLAIWAFPTNRTTVDYTVGPAIGADLHVTVTDRVALTGGMRLHAFSLEDRGVWLARPPFGARWRF